MAVKLVALHSPFVGPGTWRGLAPRLRAAGYDVAVPDFTGVMAGVGPYHENMVAIARAVVSPAESQNTILVAHSGAGALIPAVAGDGLAAGAIYLDALLPHPGLSWFETLRCI